MHNTQPLSFLPRNFLLIKIKDVFLAVLVLRRRFAVQDLVHQNTGVTVQNIIVVYITHVKTSMDLLLFSFLGIPTAAAIILT